MLYRDNEILIFDEPTAVLTPQEIDELMATMREFAKEARASSSSPTSSMRSWRSPTASAVLRKGKYIGTVNTSRETKMSSMMVGRLSQRGREDETKPTDRSPRVERFSVPPRAISATPWTTSASPCARARSSASPVVDGNGQSELLYTALPGLTNPPAARSRLRQDITHSSIAHREEHVAHPRGSPLNTALCSTNLWNRIWSSQRFQEPQFERRFS